MFAAFSFLNGWKIFAKSFWWFETGGCFCSVFSPRPFLPSPRLIAHSDPIYCLQLSVLSIQIQIGIFCSNRISVQTLGNLPLGRKPCAPSYSPDFSPHSDSCKMYFFKSKNVFVQIKKIFLLKWQNVFPGRKQCAPSHSLDFSPHTNSLSAFRRIWTNYLLAELSHTISDWSQFGTYLGGVFGSREKLWDPN